VTRPPDPVRSDSRTATEAVTDRRPLQISDLYSISHMAQPTISPDGSLVVYVMGKPERDTDTLASGLWLARIDGTGAARQLTAGQPQVRATSRHSSLQMPRLLPSPGLLTMCGRSS